MSIKVKWDSDSAALRKDMDKVEAALDGAGATARAAGAKIDGALDSTAEHADTVASKGSQAAGALSGLGDLVGGKFGAAMVAGGTAMQAAADAGDLLNVVTDSAIIRKTKDVLATGAQKAANLAAAAATKTQAAAQRALNGAMRANPIGIVITVIAALVAAIVVLYKRNETFRNSVNKDWGAVSDKIGGTITFARDKIGGLVEFLGTLSGKIRSKTRNMWDGIKDSFRSALNAVIGWWNNLSFYLDLPDKIPGLPDSITINTPNIPMLANGGIVTRPTLAVIGEAGPEAVIPLNGRYGGNHYTITIKDLPIGATGYDIGRQLVQFIDDFESVGGRARAA